MPSTLVLPLVLASLFTGGGVAILRVRHRPEDVGVALFGLFAVCAVLVAALLTERQMGGAPLRVAQGLEQAWVR